MKDIHTLLVAVANVKVGIPTVRGAGTGVVLDGTAALQGGALVQEGGAVDREGPGRGVVLADRGSGAAKTALEGLHVAGCQDRAEPGEGL